MTLISSFAKLFTSAVNERIKKWSALDEIITDSQFGFRADHGTTDAIFVLHALIDHYMSQGKRLYGAFIDYKKAFDSVSTCRSALRYKLIKHGLDSKIQRIM